MADITMADTNGLASPTLQSQTELTSSPNNQSAKRKREEGEEAQEDTNGAEGKMTVDLDEKDDGEMQRLIEDIVEILKRYGCAP